MTRGNLFHQYAESHQTAHDRLEADIFYTPMTEGRGPKMFDTEFDHEFDRDVSESQNSTASTAHAKTNGRRRRKSVGDVATTNGNYHQDIGSSPSSSYFQDEKPHSGIRPPPQTPSSHYPPRLGAQRSTSNSRMDSRNPYYPPVISSADQQQQFVECTRPLGPLLLQYRHTDSGFASRISQTAYSSHDEKNLSYVDTRSGLDWNVQGALAQPKVPKLTLPLKPCIKQKAKSTSNTPPSGVHRGYTESKALRRVKTVEFVKGGQPLLSTQPPEAKSKDVADIDSNQITKTSSPATTNRNAHRTTSCPNIMNIAKSSLACPAITRTAVHVVAVTKDLVCADIASVTPTMQTVESNNGHYQVIWDNAPEEHGIRRRRCSSSTSQVLQAVNSPAFRGLERVNTKLADWRGNRNSLSESFMPTIVVSPDEDDRLTYYDCEVEDGENLLGSAPPNSQMTSASSSRLSSRPASAPLTRRASEEDAPSQPAADELDPHYKRDRAYSAERQLRSGQQPGWLLRASRRQRRLSAPRKLSNVKEADLHFHGHRDSVTIAHARLVNSGVISPELLAHRDSVLIAKKRMHGKNHAVSAVQRRPCSRVGSWDDDAYLLPTVKESAAQTVNTRSLESILCPRQTATQQHIQIVE